MICAYTKFNSQKEVDNFFNAYKSNYKMFNYGQLVDKIDSFDWYRQEGLKIEGYITCTHDDYSKSYYFLFRHSTEVHEAIFSKKSNVFFCLRKYSCSSGYNPYDYIGLKNIWGDTLINNEFKSISLFYNLDCTLYLQLELFGKIGVVKILVSDVEEVVPISYDSIFNANEYTWGYKLNGGVGFMSISGKVITDPIYTDEENLNIFINGKALVKRNCPDSCYFYINHYNDDVGCLEPSDGGFVGNTGKYPFDDELPSSSDAYEGDSSNLWNSD